MFAKDRWTERYDTLTDELKEMTGRQTDGLIIDMKLWQTNGGMDRYDKQTNASADRQKDRYTDRQTDTNPKRVRYSQKEG
jgi:hypothetical protein